MMMNNSFMDHNNISVVEAGIDKASVRVDYNANATNYYDYFHGGVYFTISDSAAGIAARSNGDKYVTLNANINFMKAVNSGYIVANAKVVSRTNKICVVEVEVVDGKDQVVNSGTYTMYKIK
ncbi:MAG: PaaI family thioesterase [Erysipelothrix sp.]